MKIRAVVILVGLAAGFALPAIAQQKDTLKAPIAQQRDLLADVKALYEFGLLGTKEEEAFNKNDASALAALFTEDAVLVAPDGTFVGRQAIEKRYVETFQRWPITDFLSRRERLRLNCNRQCGLVSRRVVGNSSKSGRSRISLGLLVIDLCS